ncbi:MAG: hypothetical protein LBV69_05800 [Bacteroidales bacterium]|jgi:hypothetical protein|nr:hypothetical protein [Bacteroidales bacterium]
MNKLKIIIITSILIIFSNNFAKAQENSVVISKSDYENLILRIENLEKNKKSEEKDSISNNRKNRIKENLTLGGYGEAVGHRYFYSNNFNRYSYPENFTDSKSRGEFDLPHVVFVAGYKFKKGFEMYSEIEFEHGGNGSSIELEENEFGEFESDIEKGGEVNIEQFWIQKSFCNALNIRVGHVIVPIGLTNNHHLPTEYFSVLRQEEETTIFPSTWHETGISLWGKFDHWKYEVQFLSGLNAEMFNDANWIKKGSVSPYEFTISNSYAGSFRVDNTSVKGLRVGLSGYYGFSAANSLKVERYSGLHGGVTIGTFDFTYNDNNFLVYGNFDYGHLSDSKEISKINKNLPKNSPSPRTNIASDAMSYAIFAGYDVFSFFKTLKNKDLKLYIFGHYGYTNSMFKTADGILADNKYKKNIISAGINFYPIKEVAVKIEYGNRYFPNTKYNHENTISVGIVYSAFFI